MRAIYFISLIFFSAISISAFAQTDDIVYGAVYDQIQSQKGSLSNGNDFQTIQSSLNSQLCRPYPNGNPDSCVQTCNALQNLVLDGDDAAVRFSLLDFAYGFEGKKVEGRGSIRPKVDKRRDYMYRHSNGVLSRCVSRNQIQLNVLTQAIVSEMTGDSKFEKNGELQYIAAIMDQFYGKGKNFKNLLAKSAGLKFETGLIDYGYYQYSLGEEKSAFILFNEAAEQGSLEAVSQLKVKYNYEYRVPSSVNTGSSPAGSSNIDTDPELTLSTITAGEDNESKFKEQPKTVKDIKRIRYVTASPLNFRDAPEGKKLGSLAYASKVTVYEEKGEWLRISKIETQPRWIHRNYVSSTKPVDRQALKLPKQPSPRTRLSVKQCGDLRIRKLTVKTQGQFDSIERELSRGGCNSEQERLRREWNWVK